MIEPYKIMYVKSQMYPKYVTYLFACRTRHHGGPKNNLDYGEKSNFWHLVLLRENFLFKELPPSITVTRNPNWSSEILWLRIGYVKGKILSLAILSHPTSRRP